MIAVSRGGSNHVQFEFLWALVFSKSQFAVFRIVLNVDYVVYIKLESFKGRVQLLDWVGPTVTIGWNEVAAVAYVRVVKMIIGDFNEIFETDAETDPTNELFDSNSPSNFAT